jgi:hypothetical protein
MELETGDQFLVWVWFGVVDLKADAGHLRRFWLDREYNQAGDYDL